MQLLEFKYFLKSFCAKKSFSEIHFVCFLSKIRNFQHYRNNLHGILYVAFCRYLLPPEMEVKRRQKICELSLKKFREVNFC